MKLRFYQCETCGKLIAVFPESMISTECCGSEMTEIVPNHTDGAVEKHVPVVTVSRTDVSVKIGSTIHPMSFGHYIMWIGIQTVNGFAFRELHPGDRPDTVFTVQKGDRVQAVYAYCNLHGLWCSDCSQMLEMSEC